MADAMRIMPDELNRQMKDGGSVTVVDVRRGSWEESDEKIEGAIRLDPESYERDYSQVPKGSDVVTYCT